MDSKPTIPPITRRQKEKYKKGISYVYCMYCCKPHLFKDLAIREGRYDVCRSPECMDLYRKERKIALPVLDNSYFINKEKSRKQT